MSPIIITKCKTKPFTAIGMVLFGIFLIAMGAWLIVSGGSWWWLILVLFGVFCLYHWAKILIQGSMSLVLYVDSGNLYVTYDHTKHIITKMEEIKRLEHYTKLYELSKINRFWQYITRTNGVVNSDVLYFLYEQKEEVLADLDYYGATITEEDLNKILHFLLSHNPNIQIGKA